VKTPKTLGALALLLTVTSGCGYALVGRATNLPEDVKTVYLAPFENRTQRNEVDQFVTEAIADELVKRRRFTVGSESAGSDAELVGAVSAFGLTPVTFDTDGRASEYEISIVAQVTLRRTGAAPDAPALWKNDRYLFRKTYPFDPDDSSLDREENALREAAREFAETMVSDLLEGF
jgi:outer membrane lipopolysaccharide assembly protein LptE/RlpB